MITFKPASREKIGLIIGIAGPTGSGKSLSALLLARGLCGGDDSKIRAIDTESGRMLHYAPAPGQKPGKFTFGFQHGDMQPPFSPAAYKEAIAESAKNCEAMIVDSFSHEWDGEGGQHDMQTEALERMMANNANLREDSVSSLAWKKPKMEHRQLVSKMLQCRCHLIICLRAEEKLIIEKQRQPNGTMKTVFIAPTDQPIEKRWHPNCEKKFPYELTISFLVTPDRPGFPIPLKLEEQHRDFVPLDRPLSEETGRLLAEWARGGAPKASMPTPPTAPVYPPSWDKWSLQERGENRANAGIAAFREWWKTLTKDEQEMAKKFVDEWKAIAGKAAS